MKLLEFLDMQLNEWESRLKQGEVPNLGDLHRLGNIGNKIYRVIERNGLIRHH